MEFSEDLWIFIKEFIFHRHLWYLNLPYLKVIRSLPLISYNSRFYPLNFIQSHIRYSDKFIKSYNVLIWNNTTISLISYSLINNTDDIDQLLLND